MDQITAPGQQTGEAEVEPGRTDTSEGIEMRTTSCPTEPETKHEDIVRWASDPRVWAYPHDEIVSPRGRGRGPSRETIRDSLGDRITRGWDEFCRDVVFDLNPRSLTLSEFRFGSILEIQIKGHINGLVWIPDARGSRLPRKACLLQLVQCRGSVTYTHEKGPGHGTTTQGVDGLVHATIWLIYDTQTRTGRVLRINH